MENCQNWGGVSVQLDDNLIMETINTLQLLSFLFINYLC